MAQVCPGISDRHIEAVNAPFHLSQSPIKIPARFHQVLYNHERYPGAPGVRGLVGGANCQQYAYEFLREFGYTKDSWVPVWFLGPGPLLKSIEQGAVGHACS